MNVIEFADFSSPVAPSPRVTSTFSSDVPSVFVIVSFAPLSSFGVPSTSSTLLIVAVITLSVSSSLSTFASSTVIIPFSSIANSIVVSFV